MDKLHLIKEPVLKELELQGNLMREALKSQIPLIDSVSRYFLEKKGKMIRPIMVMLAAKLAGTGEIGPNTHRASIALELLHNASLIHDDVVDEADQRRGNPTVNHVWDNKVAVLMGDFFLARCLIQSTATDSLAIQKELANLASSLSEGEMEQLANARMRSINEQAYYSVIKNKTASLFIACMRIGALSVDAADATIDSLAAFGEKLGIIFQIRDDIFDYFPNDKVGKPTGNDIREGKVTLPLLYPLINGSGKEHQKMRDLVAKEDITSEDIQTLVHYAKANGGIEYAQATMQRLASEATHLLSDFPDSDAKRALIALVHYVIEREK